MTQSSSPTTIFGQTESVAPLSAIELSVLNQLLEGLSIAEIAAGAGYSDILVARALQSIQTKTESKNLMQATMKLLQTGTIKL